MKDNLDLNLDWSGLSRPPGLQFLFYNFSLFLAENFKKVAHNNLLSFNKLQRGKKFVLPEK
jgi:hypothetical protein